jgi:hypothetical protein
MGLLARLLQHVQQRQRHVVARVQVRVQVEGLEHHADAPAHGVQVGVRRQDVAPFEDDLPARWFFQPVAAAQQRGLAGSRRADDEHQLAGGHGQVHAVQHLGVAEALAQAPDVQQRGRRRAHLHFRSCGAGSWPGRPGTP